MDHEGRLGRLRHVTEQHKLDSLLITHAPNLRYLCGFTGSAGALIVTNGGTAFFTDGRYGEQARAQVHGVNVRIVRKSALAAAAEWLTGRARVHRIGIEAGRRSALPHGRASTAAIPPRGFVVCEFGVILAGYCSDMTRMVHVGRPLLKARQVYNAVREALQAALEAVRPGATTGEVDGAARKTLKRKSLEKYFTHSTGHGVGLEIHEAPRIASGQKELLRAGMVITIEPGAC